MAGDLHRLAPNGEGCEIVLGGDTCGVPHSTFYEYTCVLPSGHEGIHSCVRGGYVRSVAEEISVQPMKAETSVIFDYTYETSEEVKAQRDRERVVVWPLKYADWSPEYFHIYKRVDEPILCHNLCGPPRWRECSEDERECYGSFGWRTFPIKTV